jgi:uncharacterized protein
MPAQMEFRVAADSWPTSDFEVRAVGDGMEFAGYAAVFNSLSEDLGGFREMLMPGAFTRSINAAKNGSADIRMFWNHDNSRPLGSTKANLRLSEDSQGLVAEGTLPQTTDGRDMATLTRDRIVRSMSFGFSVPRKTHDGREAQDRPTAANGNTRTLHEVTLYEVSPVTGWPAYRATSASVRHLFGVVDWDDPESVDALIDTLTEDQRRDFFRSLNRPGTVNKTPLVAPYVAAIRARYPELNDAA